MGCWSQIRDEIASVSCFATVEVASVELWKQNCGNVKTEVSAVSQLWKQSWSDVTVEQREVIAANELWRSERSKTLLHCVSCCCTLESTFYIQRCPALPQMLWGCARIIIKNIVLCDEGHTLVGQDMHYQ